MRRPLIDGVYRISQKWGGNPTYYSAAFGIPYHNGTDYAALAGQPVYCIAAGYVAYVGFDPRGYGSYVRVWHPGLMMHSFYAHLQEIHVESPPDLLHPIPIEEGAWLGDLGSTGNSTGPHLHFEIRLGLDVHKYDISPYQGIARGRINPETMYAIFDRAEAMAQQQTEVVDEEEDASLE